MKTIYPEDENFGQFDDNTCWEVFQCQSNFDHPKSLFNCTYDMFNIYCVFIPCCSIEIYDR